MKKIAIFGSTGSIGRSSIEVIKENINQFEVVSLIARNDATTLIKQAKELKPSYVVIENEKLFSSVKESLKHIKNCQVFCGRNAVLEIAKIKCDIVISAIVGFSGMMPTLNAIKAGSNIAIANKESLVCAGEFLKNEARKKKINLIPIDSEHNAIFQIFENKNLDMIEDITLTASGGPFLNRKEDFSKISVQEALNHPRWKMGEKISIDSATMMNKGLEVIEAFHLFPLKASQIKILIHPQSIIHGMVSYKDGSTLAMLSMPDMKVPISQAISFPNRIKIKHKNLDLEKISRLDFEVVNEKKFPAIKICYECLKVGGNSPVILNASNEIAVEKFLNKEISFNKIVTIVEKTLNKIPHQKLENIKQVIEFDTISRQIAKKIC